MKKIFLLLIISCVLIMCRKDQNLQFHDLSGPNTLQGIAVLYDTLTGNYSFVPVKALDVYVKYPSDPTGYLTSKKTDNQGRYSFNGIDPDTTYVIYASIDTGKIRYYGQIIYPAKSTSNLQTDTLKLVPAMVNQNGMYIRTVDSLGGPLPFVDVAVYSSRLSWASNDTNNIAFTIKSDAFGRTTKFNVSPNWYWVRAVDSINKVVVKSKDSIQILPQGISSKYVYLK